MSTQEREALRRTLKKTDCWWTVVFVDPLALRVLPRLSRWAWVTPFRLTAAAAVLGVASAVLFATGHVALGAVCFEARFFVDCLDGKLARLRGISSPRGAFFDLGCDVALVSTNLAALGWHLAARRGVPPALPLAVVNLCLVAFWFLLYKDSHRLAPPPAQAHEPGAGALSPSRGPIAEWMARRRLVASPHMVELETLALFLMPLTGSTVLMVVGLVAAGAYYLSASARMALIVYRRLPAVGGPASPAAPAAPPATEA